MEDMDMDMVIVMDTTAMDIMDTMARERLKLTLLLSQDTILMEDMDMDMVIVMDTTAMDIMDTMARERPRLNLDTTIMVIVMVMDMAMVMVMVMDTMDNFKHQKNVLCRKLSMDKFKPLDNNSKIDNKR